MAQNLSNLPIGAKVKFGKHSINGETAQDIIWLVVAKNHTGYPSNSITLQTERIVDLRCFDEFEPSNTIAERASDGNNRYSVSNIHQWLNSDGAAGAWYVAQHSADTPPNQEGAFVNAGTKYANRPGFLNAFSVVEKGAILSTTFRTVYPSVDGTGYYDTVAKLFLLSKTEVGHANENNIAEGSLLEYYRTNNRSAFVTSQVLNHSLAASRVAEGGNWIWWLRTPHYATSRSGRYVLQDGTSYDMTVRTGHVGVRPALNLPSTLSITDTTDSDGCYTFNWNSAPPVPTTLNVPTIYGGKSATISWNSVTDPDGNPVTYQLERSINGGEFATIYSGTNPLYTTVVDYGSTSVQFRLKAIDSLGASSGYITSTSRTVINNTAPVIDGTDGSLGTKMNPFKQTYTISDTESDTVTVTETIDRVQVRSYVATRGATNTFSVEGKTWLSLANGSHTMRITATDGLDSSTRTYTFVKSVKTLTIVTNVMPASVMPTRIKVVVNRNIPPEANLLIMVCNNGFDSSPTWENATESMNNGLIHLFSNTTKTASQWGVKIRVVVNRNGGEGACYVSSIGGNFE